MLKAVPLMLLMLAALAVAGCTATGVAVGAGATIGVAAFQERGLKVAAKDTLLIAKVRANLLEEDAGLAAAMGVDAYEGRVLLAGGVEDENTRAVALAAAWRVDGVEEVINEIYLTGPGDLADFSQDAWISAKANARLAFDSQVHAINYSLTTHDRVIHVMGIARNGPELERVIGHLRDIDGAHRVVSHVRVLPQQQVVARESS
ncbi:MAG: BON domain-containing protein [Magnetospiraceae bacterium]